MFIEPVLRPQGWYKSITHFWMMFWLLVVIVCVCLSFMLFKTVNFFVSFNILTSAGYYWLLKLDYDYVNCMILVMLLVCFCYVWNYTGHYFMGEIVGTELNKIILLFVCVMARLVSTGDFLTTLVFWEYLGVVSFFLILFYCSYLSLRSSIITLVSSRLGDVALFLIISVWGFLFDNLLLRFICICLIIFTKRARFPLIRWLLEAMRAPTPVRSLVHSSTLVAAGVWFSMRYDMVMFCAYYRFYVRIILLITIIITGVCCFYFLDLKKIVALSTCNKISWCVFYLLFGDLSLSLFQLVSHGVSKCMLFMLVGDVMSGSRGSQARNNVYPSVFYKNWNIFRLFCVIIGLSGAPYIGVFFTKHFLLSTFLKIYRIRLTVTVFICVFLSYFYSFRLCKILLKIKARATIGVEFFFKTSLMVYFWLFIKWILSYYLDETNYFSFLYRAGLILFQLFSIVTAILFYKSILLRKWSSSLFGCDNLVELCYERYYLCVGATSVFFSRWDNISISKFYNIGSASLHSWRGVLLNIIMISVFWLFMCLVIV